MSVTIGPHTLTRAQLTPARYKATARQDAVENFDGSITVSGSGVVYRLWTIRIRLPRVDAQRLIAYIENSLRFRAETVPVTDGYGVTRTMRYWDDSAQYDVLGGDQVELNLPFREEQIA